MGPVTIRVRSMTNVSKGYFNGFVGFDVTVIVLLVFHRVHVGVNVCWVVGEDVNFSFEFVEETFADEGSERFGSAIDEVTWTWSEVSSRTDENNSSFLVFLVKSGVKLGTHDLGKVRWVNRVEHDRVLDILILKFKPSFILIEARIHDHNRNIETCQLVGNDRLVLFNFT